jgi:hypothetical protein
MSELENPKDVLKQVYTSLRSFESDLMHLSKNGVVSASAEDLMQLASDLHLVKAYTTELFNELQTIVTDHIGNTANPVSVDGATIEIKSGSPRKTWDHQGLINDVSKRIVDSSIDLDTGEVTKTPVQMIREALDFAGISYWKVTKLKELHLDADEYCEVGESKKSLVIRRDR